MIRTRTRKRRSKYTRSRNLKKGRGKSIAVITGIKNSKKSILNTRRRKSRTRIMRPKKPRGRLTGRSVYKKLGKKIKRKKITNKQKTNSRKKKHLGKKTFFGGTGNFLAEFIPQEITNIGRSMSGSFQNGIYMLQGKPTNPSNYAYPTAGHKIDK